MVLEQPIVVLHVNLNFGQAILNDSISWCSSFGPFVHGVIISPQGWIDVQLGSGWYSSVVINKDFLHEFVSPKDANFTRSATEILLKFGRRWISCGSVTEAEEVVCFTTTQWRRCLWQIIRQRLHIIKKCLIIHRSKNTEEQLNL